MEKYSKSKENKCALKGMVMAYGKTDFGMENYFIISSNPTVLIKSDGISTSIKYIDLIGEEVEYIPVEIDEDRNLVIGVLENIKDVEAKILSDNYIEVNSAVVTSIYPWGCNMLINGQYRGQLTNANYFISNDKELANKDGYYRGDKLIDIFSVGDEIPNLKYRRIKNGTVFDMYLENRVMVNDICNYPLKNINEVTKGMIVECRVGEIGPTGCYVKVAPKVDALCYIPDYLDSDRDIMPNDLVKVTLSTTTKGIKGKIIEIVEYSNFRY